MTDAERVPDEEAIRMHFAPARKSAGMVYRSTLVALLDGARRDTGRDPETGLVVAEEASGDWLGAAGYLILLDQIGSCFKPKGRPNAAGPSSIERTMQYWTGYSARAICAIYALRNAQLHDFSLCNTNEKHPEYRHRFAVHSDPEPLVRMPRIAWDGSHDSIKDDTTFVSLRALGDMAEGVTHLIQEQAQVDAVEITLGGGAHELRHRYGIFHSS